jgi:hypothetical protein
MKTNIVLIPAFLLLTLLLQVSCKKTDDPSDNDNNPSDTNRYVLTYNESTLVSNLNGYRFDAAFSTSEPQAYPYLWVQYIDDYLDSTRILMLNQNAYKSITQYQVSNHFNGNATRIFNHASFPNDASNGMSYSFHHPMFVLNTYDPESGTISETGTVFGINTQVSSTFTGMYDQYRYQFLNRYLIRFISGISLWPYNYPNGSDEAQFIATSELSEPKAIGHYFDESYSTFPYDVKSNMYSGFFQSKYDGTYIGVAKGSVTLDTIFLNTNPPDWYDPQICRAYIDKVDDTLYLGLLINVPNTIELLSSVYKMDLNTNNLTELYSDVGFTYGNAIFRKGCYYAIPSQGGQYVKINKQGIEEVITTPATSSSVSLKFSKNKVYSIVTDAGSDRRVEVYSRPL